MERHTLTSLVIFCMILSAGCVSHNNSPTAASQGLNNAINNSNLVAPTRSLIDMTGNTVNIPADPRRVAVFSGPVAQIPYILGIQDRIIATTPAMKLSPLLREIDPGISNLSDIRGATGEIDYELLRIAGADMVICPPLDGQLIRKRMPVPVVVITNTQGDSFHQIVDQIRFVGTVFNRTGESEKFEEFLQEMNHLVTDRTGSIPDIERIKVFCGYDPAHLTTYGNDTFLTERIAIAGCKNAAALGSADPKGEGKITPSQSEVTLEQVLAWNPDLIIIDTGSPDEIYQDKRWAPISAVKNHQVFLQPQGIFKWSRPNAESAVLYPVWLAKIAYPDRMKDVDLSDILRRYYSQFFHYHLTDNQIFAILNGSYGSSN